MLPSILILDDEAEILRSLTRVLNAHFNVHTFTDAQQALNFFEQTPTQIVLSDMKMPQMNGADFLTKIAAINPRCKRVVLTGFADVALAKQAINEGNISLYIDKPWKNSELIEALLALIEELKQENRKLNTIKKLKVDHLHLLNLQDSFETTTEQNLKIKKHYQQLLHFSANLVAMQTGDDSGHHLRCANQAKLLAKQAGLTNSEIKSVYTAALFYRIGMINLPSKLITQAFENLSLTEQRQWLQYAQHGAEILSSVPALKHSANIVKHLYERVDGTGLPDKLSQEQIPKGSLILAIVSHFDLLITGKIIQKRMLPDEALLIMKKRASSQFDQNLLSLFIELQQNVNLYQELEVALGVNNLKAGMITNHDIIDEHGHKLLAEHSKLTDSTIAKLQDYQQKNNQEPVIVFVDNSAEQSHGVTANDAS